MFLEGEVRRLKLIGGNANVFQDASMTVRVKDEGDRERLYNELIK